MTYRAPVADMVFALRKSAGLDRRSPSGLARRSLADLVEAILEEAGGSPTRCSRR